MGLKTYRPTTPGQRYKTVSDFKEITNSSRGYFDAAKATLVIRNRAGLSMNASYWFSKAIDLGGAGWTCGAWGAAASPSTG